MTNSEAISLNGRKKPRLFYGYIIVGIGFFLMTIGSGAVSSYGIFFKPLLLEFGWTRAATSGAFSLCFLAQGILSIFSGRLTDRFGPRLILTAAGFFLGLSLLLMPQISTGWQLYLFSGVLAGIGLGCIWVPVLSTVPRWFARKRGLMVGIVSSGAGVGQLIVSPLASHLIIDFGWRTSYLILGITSLAAIVATAQIYKRDPSQTGQLPDGADTENHGGSDMEPTGFSLREAMHTKRLWMLSIAYFCHGFVSLSILLHIVPHATDLGISAVSAATIISTIGGGNLVGRIGMGSAADRIGTKQAVIIGFMLSTASLFGLLITREIGMFYVFAAVFGFAWGCVVALEPPLLAESFGLKAHGAILGVIVLSVSLGSTIGPLLAGYLFDVNDSYQPAFMVFAVLSLISLILTILFKHPGRTG